MTYPSWTADLNAAEASFETYIETSFYRELQDAVAKGVSPIFLEGPPGSGKTTLLWMLQRDHTYRQQSCAFVGLRNVNSEGDFFQVIDAQLRSSVHYPPADGPTVVSSSSDQLARSVMTLIAFIEPPPLLLLDGLDEAFNPYPALRMVRLITQNTRARVVVTCRPSFRQRITGDSSLFHFLSLPAFTNAEASELLRRYEGRFADQQDYETIAALAGGNPLLLKLLVHVLNELPVDSLKEISLTKEKVIKLLLKRWISLQATEPHVTSKLVHTMGILALRGSLSLVEARALLGQGVSDFEAFPLVRSEGDTLFIAHAALRPDLLALANAFPAPDTRLKDLDFGAEAAERDSRLADNFLEPPGIAELRSGRKTIVVGDRGSGKSALFSAVTSTAAPESSQAVRIIAMKDPAGFLQNLESNGSQLSTAEQFRAAWLLAIAHSLATQLGELDSAVQAKMAARLRKAIPEGNTEEALGTLEWLWMRLRHSSVKFSLGPIVLESSGRGEASGSGRKAIDVASFLRQTARSLRALGRRAIVAVDRVDEVHKYDRERQERLVQGLFLAEGSLVDTPEIQCLIFVRTDLFELYDIQEKNKLVSRSIWLRWDRKDLLRMLINRVLANRCFSGLVKLLSDAAISQPEDSLRALFPLQVEGETILDWLWTSLQNGNGDVSPRQLILLLVLSGRTPEAQNYVINHVPVFPEVILRSAMTQLSELSYGEMVNDFRIASTFVRNCRAAKLEPFALEKVRGLFDERDGPESFQVEYLERLGFLERIVEQDADGRRFAKFRDPIPFQALLGMIDSSQGPIITRLQTMS